MSALTQVYAVQPRIAQSYRDPVDLELEAILLPLLPECYNYLMIFLVYVVFHYIQCLLFWIDRLMTVFNFSITVVDFIMFP